MHRIESIPNPAGGAELRLHVEGHAPVSASAGETAADLIARARVAGLAGPEDDLAVFADDADEPLEDGATLSDGSAASPTLFLAARTRIEATVHHDGRFVGRQVSPATRIRRLRDQAVEALGLDSGEAHHYALQFCDTDVRPDDRQLVGALDRNRDWEICFDLVRVRPATVTIMVNGEAKQIKPGKRSVREIKRVGGVAEADVLEQVVGGRLTELDDEGHVQIEGGEEFISHPRDSASS